MTLPTVLLGLLLSPGCGDADEPTACVKVLGRTVMSGARTIQGTSTITSGEAVCTFDRPSLTHACEYFDIGEDGAKVFRHRTTFWWATIGDLRRNRRPVGVETALGAKSEVLLSDPAGSMTCAATFEYLYDGAGRLTGDKIIIVEGDCDWGGATWTEWDQAGRPTRGRGIGACAEQDVSQTFDDAKRVATRTMGDGGCGPSSSTGTFDELGILVESIETWNGVTTEATYKDRETIDVCP